MRTMPDRQEERPTDGRHWVQVLQKPDYRFGFASDGKAPILDMGLGSGLDLPFGCRMGSCGMCCAKLIEGQVDQSTEALSLLFHDRLERTSVDVRGDGKGRARRLFDRRDRGRLGRLGRQRGGGCTPDGHHRGDQDEPTREERCWQRTDRASHARSTPPARQPYTAVSAARARMASCS